MDPVNREQFPGRVVWDGSVISRVERIENAPAHYIMPGFVDAHVHVESSMLVPSAFARMAVVHGTVATISDPHEIANVCGMEGVEFMIKDGKRVPFKFYFGAPGCVPATPFETAGAELDAGAIRQLMLRPEIHYLSEMMNWPGVLHRDALVMDKIRIAHELGKPVDGHAPGLKGADAARYASAGISTDHECFTLEEALDKLEAGMHILIREGSAAKNFEALIPLMAEHANRLMFCSDDKHPDDLVLGHINQLVARAVEKGHDIMEVLRAACVNPVKHYGLDVGLLQTGDPADFIVVEDLEGFKVVATYINGALVAERDKSRIEVREVSPINKFSTTPKTQSEFEILALGSKVRVIVPEDGQLVTGEEWMNVTARDGKAIADHSKDILKFTVVNRYEDAAPAIAFIKNFGLKRGAIASTVGHDSHNILAVGADDASLCRAVNLLIATKGGLSVVDGSYDEVLPLPVAGLMSMQPGEEVARLYSKLDKRVKEMGCTLKAPFMTLSFMALLVIPSLKLSDKGLFDGSSFKFVHLFGK